MTESDSKALQCGCLRCLRENDVRDENMTTAPGGGVYLASIPREITRMVVCSKCGNKRCPHATDHRNLCTGKNDTGQQGSVYGALPPNFPPTPQLRSAAPVPPAAGSPAPAPVGWPSAEERRTTLERNLEDIGRDTARAMRELELIDKLREANRRLAWLERELHEKRGQLVSWRADIVMLNQSLKEARRKLTEAEKRTIKYWIVAKIRAARQFMLNIPRGRARADDE